MPRYSNGRVPASELITLDTGNGRHLTTRASAARWYALRRNVLVRTGVTLYISPGMNAYRDWDEQGVGRRNACAAGNCAAAASQGTSSHGGSMRYSFTGWQWVDAMAFDIGNYWAIPWAVFVEECARVGFEAGLITRAIAGIEEPWHIIDRDPYGPIPAGLEATPFEEDDMGTIDNTPENLQVIKNAMLEFFESTAGPRPGRTWQFLANPHNVDKQKVKDALVELFARDAPHPPEGMASWPFFDFLYNAIQAQTTGAVDVQALVAALVPALVEHLPTAGDTDLEAIAKAVADEQARRMAS